MSRYKTFHNIPWPWIWTFPRLNHINLKSSSSCFKFFGASRLQKFICFQQKIYNKSSSQYYFPFKIVDIFVSWSYLSCEDTTLSWLWWNIVMIAALWQYIISRDGDIRRFWNKHRAWLCTTAVYWLCNLRLPAQQWSYYLKSGTLTTDCLPTMD